MHQFPTEIKLEILSFLDLKTLLTISQCDRYFRFLARTVITGRPKILIFSRDTANDQEFFAKYSKHLGHICQCCKNSMNSMVHPVYTRLKICESCIGTDFRFMVMRHAEAVKLYHIPKHELNRLSKSVNYFAEKRCLDYWVTREYVESLAMSMFGSSNPIPRQDAIKLKRRIGTRKRQLRAKIAFLIYHKLYLIGYTHQEITMFRKDATWRAKLPKFDFDHGNYTLNKDPKLYLDFAVNILDQLKTRSNQYTTM